MYNKSDIDIDLLFVKLFKKVTVQRKRVSFCFRLLRIIGIAFLRGLNVPHKYYISNLELSLFGVIFLRRCFMLLSVYSYIPILHLFIECSVCSCSDPCCHLAYYNEMTIILKRQQPGTVSTKKKISTVLKTAVQNIPWLAAVVGVFSFFLLLYLITGVTVTSMLVYVTLMLSVISLTHSTYFLDIKIRHTVHRCNAFLIRLVTS